MQLLTWLDALGAADSSASAAPASRRAALARLGRAALTAVPAAGVVPAVAGPPARVASITTEFLYLALRVARAQTALLSQALTNNVPPTADRTLLELVRDTTLDLAARIEAISISGDALPPVRQYSFTGSPTGPGPFDPNSYPDVLLLAQVFADTLSRVLISALGSLANNTAFAELAAQLLGTNSRLAALVRRARQAQVAAVQPWVIKEEEATNLPVVFVEEVPVYGGESSERIFGVLNLAADSTDTGAIFDPLPAVEQRTAAFDQPLLPVGTEIIPYTAVNQLLERFELP